MDQQFNFFKTTMPKTRKADYYLGCLDGSVFMDFNLSTDNRICLRRISFDGYGCCSLGDMSGYLSYEDSEKFIAELEKEELDDRTITSFVKKLININKALIWAEAIERYGLMRNDN